MTKVNMAEAIVAGISEEMRRDERVFLTGFGATHYGGILNSVKGIWQEFGDQRVYEMPMTETGFFGICAGAAMQGMRPVFDLGFAEYLPYITQPLCAELGSVWYQTVGKLKVPIVVSAKQGVCGNLSHTRGFNSWLIHVPGIKVVIPSNVKDAKGLWKAAIRDNNPVVIIEPMDLFADDPVDIPDEEYLVPIGVANIERAGQDMTIVAAGAMVGRAVKAADSLAASGVEVEIVDLRSLAPMDTETIIKSVRKTGRLLIAHDDWKIGGFGAEIAAVIAEHAMDQLKSPIRRLASPHVPVPYPPELEAAFFSTAEDIESLCKTMLNE